jgi:chromosome segregation ATPase
MRVRPFAGAYVTPHGEPPPGPEAVSKQAPSNGDVELAGLRERVAELERELARLRANDATMRHERRRLLAALNAAEAEVAELISLRHEVNETRDAAYWLAVTQSSRLWRMAAPFRAARRALGRTMRRGE